MVEVFRTNITSRKTANKMAALVQEALPGARINFDLSDCDRILRVEATVVCVDAVIQQMEEAGCRCAVLEE